MTIISRIEAAPDRMTEVLIAGLEREFGRGAGTALAARFLNAEEADFCWEARVAERWLGAFESVEDDDRDLDRVVVLGRMSGCWFVAQMIVDGEGCPQGVLGRRNFVTERSARKALVDAR